MTDKNLSDDFSQISSDSSLTRKEFIKKVVKGTALTGGVIAAPQVLDKFLVPKAYAATSQNAASCATGGTTTAGGGLDTIIFISGSGFHVTCGTAATDTAAAPFPSKLTSCANGGDNNPLFGPC